VRQHVVDLAGQPGALGDGCGLRLGGLRCPQLDQQALRARLRGPGLLLGDQRRAGEGADGEQERGADVLARQRGEGHQAGQHDGGVHGGEDDQGGRECWPRRQPDAETGQRQVRQVRGVRAREYSAMMNCAGKNRVLWT
jgi:hypothetical protein